jgi:hypothetical protein
LSFGAIPTAYDVRLVSAIAVVGIDIGKNSFYIVGLDQRGAIVVASSQSQA